MAGTKYKDNKPEMEKKRRSRINESLSCLKLLVLGEVKRKNTRISKLDKADILEMAVEYVQRMNLPSHMMVPRVDKYRAGFNACAEEVRKHLAATPEVDVDVRTRIVDHLANFVQNLQWLRRHDILPYNVTARHARHDGMSQIPCSNQKDNDVTLAKTVGTSSDTRRKLHQCAPLRTATNVNTHAPGMTNKNNAFAPGAPCLIDTAHSEMKTGDKSYSLLEITPTPIKKEADRIDIDTAKYGNHAQPKTVETHRQYSPPSEHFRHYPYGQTPGREAGRGRCSAPALTNGVSAQTAKSNFSVNQNRFGNPGHIQAKGTNQNSGQSNADANGNPCIIAVVEHQVPSMDNPNKLSDKRHVHNQLPVVAGGDNNANVLNPSSLWRPW